MAKLNPDNLRNLIRWVLQQADLHSDAAEELLLGTAAHESHLGLHLIQYPHGPARGIYQMEPATENDIWKNYLYFRKDRKDLVKNLTGATTPNTMHLQFNPVYSTLMARLHYKRIPDPLPEAEDLIGLAHYWDQHYNRNPHKGFPQQFINYDGGHYAGEISAGGRAGNSLKMWRRNGIWGNYIGYLNRVFTQSEFDNHYTELYVRWYVKIPPEWDVQNTDYMKWNRLHFGPSQGSTRGEWYFNVTGASSFKAGRLALYAVDDASEGWIYAEETVTEMGLNDGNWHSIELRFKLNSTTGADDGEADLWVDGEHKNFCATSSETSCQTGTYENINAGQTGEYFTDSLPPAIGNIVSGGSGDYWNMDTNDWYAIEFDDYVLSTTYIGPITGNVTGITISGGVTIQ